jgi:methylphosphotriester-DNA--protein-cysteine methyltransferase
MSIEQDLLNLKSKGEQLNTQKIQNATKLAALEEEKNKLLSEAAELGIDPTQIEIILSKEEAAIQVEVSALQEQLDKVLSDIRSI